ncbi:MAG TPA: glycoside hydrolase family 52 protein [Opitutaceae bacterium]|nr:glycoside hydrolase family 52 protein [Opitutaceae bacterium]
MTAPANPAVESFHTQHSPFGAFASFSIGLVGSPGGFGQSLRGAGRQNVYVGFRAGGAGAEWQMLPFFRPPQSNEAAFTGADPGNSVAPTGFRMLSPAEYERTLGWASDTWRAEAGRFGFGLLSPFSQLPDPATLSRPAARFALAPAITGWIEFDNRTGAEPVELMFGVGELDRLQRPVQDAGLDLPGFAVGPDFGYVTARSSAVEQRLGFDVFAPKFRDYRGVHVIGGESALIFQVPARQRKRFPLALGFYQGGIVTTGIPARYAYAQFFASLEDVLEHTLANRARYEKIAAQRDRELARAPLDADQKFLLAQAAHSYLGSTQLLWHKGKPLWVVNEGEYRMVNTFDLTVDHLFWELEWTPWAVRDALDLFVDRYSYTDKISVGGKLVPGGLSFTHDMGVMNHFTPAGHSSYECDHLHGCFSHMTMEQLLNWVLCAVTYSEKTGDVKWLRKRQAVLLACAESMRRRDHPNPQKRDGIMKHDSARCGLDGAEITTYDSLDVSLGQARNNLYLAVKTLGAWVLLEQAFKRLGRKADSAAAHDTAGLLAKTLATKFEADTQSFPAVFEKGNRSRIIPAVEGFVYPLYLGIKDVTARDGRFAELLGLLSKHLCGILQPGICLDGKSGGWKMSSTSTNTWFSKIAISQHVVRTLFPEAMTDAARAADRVHADWQRRPGCGEHAMCDQINSETGVTCGSRYYPRGVTTILWLRE